MKNKGFLVPLALGGWLLVANARAAEPAAALPMLIGWTKQDVTPQNVQDLCQLARAVSKGKLGEPWMLEGRAMQQGDHAHEVFQAEIYLTAHRADGADHPGLAVDVHQPADAAAVRLRSAQRQRLDAI